MARKIVVLLSVLLLSGFHGMSVADWTDDLNSDINRMTQNINSQVQRFTQRLRAQIEQSVQSSVQPALEEVSKIVENLPRDAHGRIITTNANTIIVNSGNGITRSIISGRTQNGEPYVRDTEERYVGNVLYHNETFYNPKTNVTERICWKLDLAKPGAVPESLTNEQCNTN